MVFGSKQNIGRTGNLACNMTLESVDNCQILKIWGHILSSPMTDNIYDQQLRIEKSQLLIQVHIILFLKGK